MMKFAGRGEVGRSAMLSSGLSMLLRVARKFCWKNSCKVLDRYPLASLFSTHVTAPAYWKCKHVCELSNGIAPCMMERERERERVRVWGDESESQRQELEEGAGPHSIVGTLIGFVTCTGSLITVYIDLYIFRTLVKKIAKKGTGFWGFDAFFQTFCFATWFQIKVLDRFTVIVHSFTRALEPKP